MLYVTDVCTHWTQSVCKVADTLFWVSQPHEMTRFTARIWAIGSNYICKVEKSCRIQGYYPPSSQQDAKLEVRQLHHWSRYFHSWEVQLHKKKKKIMKSWVTKGQCTLTQVSPCKCYLSNFVGKATLFAQNNWDKRQLKVFYSSIKITLKYIKNCI